MYNYSNSACSDGLFSLTNDDGSEECVVECPCGYVTYVSDRVCYKGLCRSM